MGPMWCNQMSMDKAHVLPTNILMRFGEIEMKAKKRRYALIVSVILAVLAVGLIIGIISIYPISPTPVYDVDTYEEFRNQLEGQEQEYLIPAQADLQFDNSSILFRIDLKDRSSYEPNGYVCSIRSEEEYEKRILYIIVSDTPRSTAPIDSSYKTSYDEIELVCMQENEYLAVQFQYKDFYYLIQSYDNIQPDALSVAKHMIDGRNLE